MFEDATPRAARGALLADLGREDLDPYGVEELEDRLSALLAEAERTKAALQRKKARREAADALFSFKDS